MIFKSNIKVISFDGNYTLTNYRVEMTAKLNGEQFVNEADYMNASFTPVTLPISGKVVTPSAFSNTGFQFEINNTVIGEELDLYLKIKIVYTGGGTAPDNYFDYENIIKLFGYDLGYNSTDPKVELVFNSVESVADSVVHSIFAFYPKPFTKQVYFVDLTNSIGLTETNRGFKVYDSDWLLLPNPVPTIAAAPFFLEGRNGFYCGESDFIPFQFIEVPSHLDGYIISNVLFDPVSTVDNTTLTVEPHVFSIPKKYVETDCVDCETSCVIIGAENFARTSFEPATFNTFFINGLPVYEYETIYLKYQLFKSDGTLVKEEIFEVDTATYEFFDIDAAKFSLSVEEEIGDYLLVVTHYVPNVFSCVTKKVISYCNLLSVTKEDCGLFTITNRSNTQSETYQLYKFGNDIELGESTLVESVTLSPLYDKTFSLTDGLYGIKIGETLQIIPVYCAIETCLLTYTKDIVCSSCGKCGDCACEDTKTMENFNKFMLIAYNVFAIIHSNYFLSTLFNTSDIEEVKAAYPNDVEKLFTLVDLIDKAREYCTPCNTAESGCSSCQ
jgi:hypothetical protein